MLRRLRQWRPATWIVLAAIAAWMAITYVFFASPGPESVGAVLIWLGLLAIWFFGTILGAAVLMLIWLWRRQTSPHAERTPEQPSSN